MRPKSVEKKSGLQLVVQRAQRFGLTHPKDGYFLMLPPEFDAILAIETKAVAQVVLEILRETLGWIGDGRGGRREWVQLSYRHFVRKGIMPLSAAYRGMREALKKGYIVRRLVFQDGLKRYEYAIHWRSQN